MKKKIHLILPGGGAKGVFQAGFLYRLHKKYNDKFVINYIDSTSVGALNGSLIMVKEYEQLKNIWFNINKLSDIFIPWCNIPFFGKIITLIISYFRLGLCSNKHLKKLITKIVGNNIKNISSEEMIKFRCTVMNLYKGETEYIKGNNDKLVEYLTASASPWILSRPSMINNNLYTDGGLIELYPLKYIDNTHNVDITLLLGYYKDIIPRKKKYKSITDFISDIIDICRLQLHNSEKIKNMLLEKNKYIMIENTHLVDYLDFNNTDIKEGFKKGEDEADIFYEKFLK